MITRIPHLTERQSSEIKRMTYDQAEGLVEIQTLSVLFTFTAFPINDQNPNIKCLQDIKYIQPPKPTALTWNQTPKTAQNNRKN